MRHLYFFRHVMPASAGYLAIASVMVVAIAAPTNCDAASFLTADIGTPAIPGSVTSEAGGYTITGAGTNIGGTSDQFFFDYQAMAGDFDLQVRVEALSLSDVWAKAGLMAREQTNSSSRFTMVVSTPSAVGAFFLARSTTSGAAMPGGQFPVTYPETWLRLMRAGSTFTGYAGIDGKTWVQLGSVTLSSPSNTFLVGMAVTGANATQGATAQFRALDNAGGGTVVPSLPLPSEPPGPATRNTGLVISEIMYHPKPSTAYANQALEFIEIYNAGLITEDMSGYRLAGDILYTFPANTLLPAGGILVVARYPELLQAAYGLTGVFGPWLGAETNGLPDAQGHIRLFNRFDGMPLEVHYDSASPWPLAADGAGHSLVLARPSYGQDNVKAWAASDQIGGSPGRLDPISLDAIRNVVINEFLANSEPPLTDFIELYNHSNQEVDLSGAWLSDARDAYKFRIPDGTRLPGRGFCVFTEADFNPTPGTNNSFALSSLGERIYLVNSNQTRVIDVVAFEGQAPGVSSGRYPDGGPGFYEMKTRTPGTTNSPPLIRDIVINEIMFNPISGNTDDQYVELYNRGTNAINVSNWQFTDGISFSFPANTVIPVQGYLVVAKNAARLIPRYPQLSPTNTVGDFSGTLAKNGERLALSMPSEYVVSTNSHGVIATNINWVVVNEVWYPTTGRWTKWADGGGSSLELIDPNSDNRLAANWADSDESAKAPWTNFVYSDYLDWVYPVNADGAALNEVQVMLLGAGEVLLDDIRVGQGATNNVVANSTFDSGLTSWLIQGNHVHSHLEPIGPGNPSQSLHLQATGGGDNGANRVECDLTATLAPGANTNATITAKLRWLRGYRDVLIRLHGGGLEGVCTLPVPENLGTPGLRNSRAVTNAGPAIYEVSHSPVLPAANQAVVVTARVRDPDGIALVQLQYRVDSLSPPAYTKITMWDNGTGGDAVAGDGIYSATIPAQGAGVLVTFRVMATDSNAVAGTTYFPPDAPDHECLVRFGDPQPFGTLGVYRLWVTAAKMNTWMAREGLSDEPVDGTFVYNNCRAIYDAGGRFRGSPFIRPGWNNPTGGGQAWAYVWILPQDDRFMGADELNLDSGEHGGRDSTTLREPTAFVMAGQSGLPVSYQRFVHLVINGVTEVDRGYPVFLDVQNPNTEYIDCWFPDDNHGEIFKADDWFEYSDGPGMQGNKSGNFGNFTAKLGGKKQSRYRWNWEKKSNKGLNDDYSSLYACDNALNAADASYVSMVQTIMSEEFIAGLAFGHVAGDWDRYGYSRGKNMFTYRPAGKKFHLLLWDLDFSFGCSGGHGPTQGLFDVAVSSEGGSDNMPEISRLYNHPYFRRIYMQALLRIADGPLQDTVFGPILDARYRTLLANGVNMVSPYVGSGAQGISIPDWLQQRRAYIYSVLAPYTNTAFYVSSPANVTSSSNMVTITGAAPLGVKTIKVNGQEFPVTWTSVNAWAIRLPLLPGTNSLAVQPYDSAGNLLSNAIGSVSANFNGTMPDPRKCVVINEIMFAPAVADAEYVELYNTSSNITFDLSGWVFQGLSYTFPTGSFIGPRTPLILAKDNALHLATYGTNAPIFDHFNGNLKAEGETLTLIKPGATPDLDVVVDQVRYEGALPWNTNALGTGSSRQLIDPLQDNSRPGNWFSAAAPARWTDPINFPGATNEGWRYVQYTGLVRINSTNAIYMDTKGDVYLDDISLVLGSDPSAGPNLLQNGDFEGPFGPAWQFWGTNLTNSAISTNRAHSGRSSLHVVSTGPAGPSKAIVQNFPTPATNATCTLSYWFYSSTNGNNLTVRTYPVPCIITTTNIQPTVIPPSYTPAQFIPGTNSLSPAAANPVATNLPAIPPLWLNEVQPENSNGFTDALGHHVPWLELYNAGTNVESLNGLYLANTYTNLTQWAFPAGATIQPGEFKIVFADGADSESALSELHTSFALTPGSGSLALSRLYKGQPQVLDYLTYSGVPPNSSYGSWPDGQLFTRQIFYYASPGRTNDRRSAPIVVYINEWMANNTRSVAHPADGKFGDWFELYNPGPGQADLSGYYLTHDLTVPLHYQIPPGYIIPPGGFLLVWADNETTQNSSNRVDLHVDFKLSKTGTSIGLFAAYGTPVSTVTFGQQIADLSQGHYPDGTGPIYAKMTPTPRMPNLLPPSATSPQLGGIAMDGSASTLSFSFMGYSGVLYRIEYKDDLGATDWTPLATYVGSNSMIVVTDTLSPIGQRFYRVVVQ
ncbi:MAG: lamin tail domain-containing protein [Verrucomicrobia bacterium]|nr:lamin tail domain-containing protein [Verrucomicrobiota bacterium]